MIRTFRVLAVAPCLLVASVADAQSHRCLEKLDAEARSRVEAIIAASRADELPTEWLFDAACEGIAHRGTGSQIVNFVSKRAGFMTVARNMLTPATEAEIVSGAGVLERGVRRETLAELRKKRPRGDLTMSLGILENLVARGVPGDTAAAVMVALASSGLRDNDLELFKERVNRDIAIGINPSAAATARAEMLTLDAPNSLGSSRGPTAAAPLPKRPP